MANGLLHHIEINVSNLKRSRNFWDWLLYELGYEKFQEWDEGISWRQDETYLVFVQTEDYFLNKYFHRKNTGLNHLAFQVEDKAAVDKWTKQLKIRGWKILYENRHPYAAGSDHYAVFFEDPDRIKVELVADK